MWFERLKRAVRATKDNLVAKVEDLLSEGRQISPELLEELEMALIGADVGVQAASDMLAKIKQQVDRKLTVDAEQLKGLLKGEMLQILASCERRQAAIASDIKPWIIMVVGVNGTGKTTTIGKLSYHLSQQGKTTLICASDTFRAAAVEQLDIWAQRSGTQIVKQQRGADPSAVLFDAIGAAKARGIDVLIADTAGRLHTKTNLMAELEKMRRVAAREVQGAPHEVLLVLDATTGQNGLAQAREFLKAAGVTGLVVTKLDGTAKGGIVVAIAKELKLPIKYVGIGEGIEDLMPFSAEAFVESLFSE